VAAHHLSGSVGHCVRTATLVAPRVAVPASLKRTKIRLVAGLNATVPLPLTKTAKVGVSDALIWVVTLPAGGVRHAPVLELV